MGRLQSYLSSLQYGTLATLTGRYYAMDRDKRYERIKLAFEGLVKGQGEKVAQDKLIQVRELAIQILIIEFSLLITLAYGGD